MSLVSSLKQRLFRWQSDGTTRFRLGQRRIFIVPTRAGLLFATALLVMLIGAINYNLALGHALVFLLAGLGMAGMVHTFRNLHGLLVTPGRSEAVFAGETAHFTLTLDNDRKQPRQALELGIAGEKTVPAAVDRLASTKINIPLLARQRGWLELPRIRLSTVYPLGLFVAWSYLQPAMRCLVYPQPLFSALPPPRPTAQGGARSGEGGEEDFAGFRERQPADSPRHVAWKASARQNGDQGLLVKQFAGGAETELQLDWASTAGMASSEERLSLLTGWVISAADEGCRYSLAMPGQNIPPGSGEAHRRHCLEALALFPA